MNYGPEKQVKMESVALCDLTPMEARCVESADDLKVGDDVVVVYLSKVVDGLEIPLMVPFIAKTDKFGAYVDRLLDVIAARKKAEDEERVPEVVEEVSTPEGQKPAEIVPAAIPATVPEVEQSKTS